MNSIDGDESESRCLNNPANHAATEQIALEKFQTNTAKTILI